MPESPTCSTRHGMSAGNGELVHRANRGYTLARSSIRRRLAALGAPVDNPPAPR